MEEKLNKVYAGNTHQYNLDKTIEELLELALVLTQLKNKPNRIKADDVISEIADVKVRLPYLERIYSRVLIKKAMKKKINLIIK